MRAECFARRIMGPFQGVLQVIRAGDAEAESTDGVNWVLYVAHRDILAHSGLSEVRFGTWSKADGLRRAVVRGTAGGRLIERLGEPLLGALETSAAAAPFPLNDRREYWLVDAASGDPLALIDTRLASEALPPAELPRWLPGQAARIQFCGLDRLEAAILRRAGRHPVARWFDRAPDGSGRDQDGAMHLPGFFPRFPITRRWPDSDDGGLAERFVDWLAPALLQLQHLDDAERARFERVAARRPEAMARLFRLYPKTLDQQLLTTARVRARMLASGDALTGYREPFVWTE